MAHRAREAARARVGVIGVITESIACLSVEAARDLGILVVPMWILRGERSYRDGADVTLTEVLTWLEEGPPYPTASAPSPADYLAAYHEAQRRGWEQALVLTVAGWLSGAHQHALRAAARASLRVRVVDTGTAAAAQGLVVEEAARRLRRGFEVEEVERWVREAGSRAWLVALVRSLEHLHRTGRVPRLARWLNRNLGAVPLLAIGGGRIRPVGIAAGVDAALERLVSRVRRASRRLPRLRARVTEADMQEEARRLAGAIGQLLGTGAVDVVPFTPVMAASTGPGVLGVAWVEV